MATTTLSVEFRPSGRYDYNDSTLDTLSFTAPTFFDACRLTADFMKRKALGEPWKEVSPKFNWLKKSTEFGDSFIGGDRESWDANPLFLEAVRSFF